jgi:hypothetical protein
MTERKARARAKAKTVFVQVRGVSRTRLEEEHATAREEADSLRE